MVKWSLQIPTWKNWYKAITKNISYTNESVQKALDYLSDCTRICKDISDKKDLTFDRLPISDDDLIAGFHYFQFKKFFDGNINDFEETYIMDVLLHYFQMGYAKFNNQWENVYENFQSQFQKRNSNFQKGIKLAQQKNDHLKVFTKLYKDYIN